MRSALPGLALALAISGAACGGGEHRPAPVVQTTAQPVAAPVVRTPLDFGRDRVAAAITSAHSTAVVRIALSSDAAAMDELATAGVTLDARPESFAAVSRPAETLVVGRDEVGAMYGALEIAERLENEGAAALPLPAPIAAAPAVPIRAANIFLVMPAPGEERWWFREESFWQEYLDLLARARMNLLDLHGMYNLANTWCPNALLYFATSPSFPEVGAPRAEREANLRMLARVVDMARERGIRVALMSYRSDTSLTGVKERSPLGDAELEVYVREAVKDVAERVPLLHKLGFRIGESTHDASWYKSTFIQGIGETRAATSISTRSWLTRKAEILDLARASSREVLVEAKYNGEQMGPPYPIAGGLLSREDENFSSYSYEDYLDAPAPYTFIFHIWGGGTNRVFRFASYEHVRRAVPTTLLGPAKGFSLMPTHAFYPQYDFWHQDPADRYSPWAFRRDELEYLLFGRLGYDPKTPEATFRAALRRRAGTDGLWDALQAASQIPVWIVTTNACGFDQRQAAPELEWGFDVGFWASPPDVKGVRERCNTSYHGPLDPFAFASPHDAAEDLLAGRATTRVPPQEVARIVLDLSMRARAASSVPIDGESAEARDVVHESVALSYLGEYFADKLRAAAALAVYLKSGQRDYLAAAEAEVAAAHRAWRSLATSTQYIAPFKESMRMTQKRRFDLFHWSLQKLDEDDAALKEAPRHAAKRRGPPLPPAKTWLDAPRAAGPGLASIEIDAPDPTHLRARVELAAPPPPDAVVRVLHKGLSALTDWKVADARGSGTTFEAVVPRVDEGGFFAVEIAGKPGVGWRYPDVVRETPYRVFFAPR